MKVQLLRMTKFFHHLHLHWLLNIRLILLDTELRVMWKVLFHLVFYDRKIDENSIERRNTKFTVVVIEKVLVQKQCPDSLLTFDFLLHSMKSNADGSINKSMLVSRRERFSVQ